MAQLFFLARKSRIPDAEGLDCKPDIHRRVPDPDIYRQGSEITNLGLADYIIWREAY